MYNNYIKMIKVTSILYNKLNNEVFTSLSNLLYNILINLSNLLYHILFHLFCNFRAKNKSYCHNPVYPVQDGVW